MKKKDDTGEQEPHQEAEESPRAQAQRQTHHLTKRFVESLTTTENGGQRWYDREVRAFGIRVWPSKRRSYFLDYTSPVSRKRRRLSLGDHGVLTPDTARREARRVLALVAAGRDPLEERAQVRGERTLKAWTDEYAKIAAAEKRHSKQRAYEVGVYLARACERFGRKRLGEITARDVEGWRDEEAKRGVTTANMALGALSACLGEAWRRDLIPSNPCAKVRRIPGEQPRQRILTEKELKALVKAVDSITDPWVKAGIAWLLSTGARQSEVRRAQWADLDLSDLDRATWRIPAPKNKRPITKPLPRHLAEELAALPRVNLFALGRFGEQSATMFNMEWRKARDAAGLPPDVHCHDLRRTFGLYATRSAGLHVAAKLLGHADTRTTEQVYSPLQDTDLRDAQAEVVAKILPFKKKEAEKS